MRYKNHQRKKKGRKKEKQNKKQKATHKIKNNNKKKNFPINTGLQQKMGRWGPAGDLLLAIPSLLAVSCSITAFSFYTCD